MMKHNNLALLKSELNSTLTELQQIKLENIHFTTYFKYILFQLQHYKQNSKKYDFISRINSGNSLLVGEGNFSFSVSLRKKLQNTSLCTTSTYEDYNNLSNSGKLNASILENAGLNVLYNIDATKLNNNFKNNSFDTIIFQFPHTGTRDAIEGLNSNYVLSRNFIISATSLLKENGVILITIVDNDFYNNIFKFEELATDLNINSFIKYQFNPDDYPEYRHSMTHQEDSGIEDYSKFATWELMP